MRLSNRIGALAAAVTGTPPLEPVVVVTSPRAPSSHGGNGLPPRRPRSGIGRGRRRLLVFGGVVVIALGTAGSLLAFFTGSSAAGSAGAAQAVTVDQGATPGAVAAAGRSVAVSWGETTLSNGHPVDGYLVSRYSTSGVPQTVLPGCDGVVTTTSCTE